MAEFGFGDILQTLASGINVATGINNLFSGNSQSSKTSRRGDRSLQQKLLESAGMAQQIGMDAIGYAAGPFGAYRRMPTQAEAMRSQLSNQIMSGLSSRMGGGGMMGMVGQQGGGGGGLRDRQSLVNLITERMGSGGQVGGGTTGANGINPQLIALLQKLGLNTTMG